VLSALLSEAQRSSSFTAALPGLSPSQDQRATQHASIVGMWMAGFYHGDHQWDAAIEQFYADGNEMTNDNAYPSGGRKSLLGSLAARRKRSIQNETHRLGVGR
jgi:hypothetical protein